MWLRHMLHTVFRKAPLRMPTCGCSRASISGRVVSRGCVRTRVPATTFTTTSYARSAECLVIREVVNDIRDRDVHNKVVIVGAKA